MSGAASISGLASGLNTADIINQLMQLEAVPQVRLQSRVKSEQLAVNAMQTLNSKVAGLAGRAADLMKGEAWAPLKAASSNDKITVTTGTSADASSFSLTVDRTALSHRLEFATATGLDDAGSVPASVRLDRLDGTATVDLATDGTLQGLVDAINDPASSTGLRATAVKVGADSYRLLVESASTGAASDFTLKDAGDGTTDVLGGAVARAGRDAQLTLGSSITVTSATNTFSDVVPGVSVTLAAGATGTADVSITRDTGKLSAQVQTFVEAVNGVLAEIDSLTAYNPTTKASGMLAGDSGVRDLRSKVLDTVFPVGDEKTLAGLGIQTDRTGRLVFDKAAFESAYGADPAAVTARFTATGTGFATRVEQVARTASDKVDGSLTLALTGRNAAIKRLNDGIESWDTRLELRRTALTRQFTALETALSRMNSQSTWLAGQISSLPTSGS